MTYYLYSADEIARNDLDTDINDGRVEHNWNEAEEAYLDEHGHVEGFSA